MNIIVLGAGLVGTSMAIDLAKDSNFSVTVIDINKQRLDKIPDELRIRKILLDVTSEKCREEIKNYDIILSALPGFMGFKVLKMIIEEGKNVVDISFFPENPFELDKLAKNKNVTAVVDCGVAPGMSNMFVGYVNSQLDSLENVLIYVGGLPIVREYPFEYKAVFSPIDVIEEYTRPAYHIENNKRVIRPALSEREYLTFPEIGTLEAFNTDGLRTLAVTLKAANMKEKTLRYPGHAEKMLMLRESGFFSDKPIEFDGVKIKPIDFTIRMLLPLLELKPEDRDFTVMRVIVEGWRAQKKYRYTYNLLDYYDEKTNTHSMARTTGYTATMVIRLLARGLFDEKGICPPEFIGQKKKCLDFVLHGLKERGVSYREEIETLNEI
ncbi:MAG: saccharopine dehydrogenase C-terminal domain-containing protein [Ignavibacteria bacterium]